LIDALDGRIMWAQEFEAEGGNVFELQDQIKENVVTELQVALTQGEMARLRHRQTDEPRAYELFLQGLELYWNFDKVDGLRAKELLEEAVAVDPDFASAHAFLGWMALKRARLGYSDDEAADRALATALADKALEIDASTVDALTLLAEINIDARKYARAMELYEKAVALSPNHADNLAWYGWRLSFGPVGRTAEGLPLIKKAMRLSPFYPNWYLGGLGDALFSLGRYEEALAAWEERQRRIPDSWFPHVYLAYGYALSGKTEKAKSAVAALLDGNPEFTTVRFAKLWGPSFSNQSETEKAVAALRNAGLPDNLPLLLPDKPSIAVLPFTNMSGDPEQEYFADGMTDDLITDLSKISGLFVIARNSSFSDRKSVV
jgi:adenylate cyclase